MKFLDLGKSGGTLCALALAGGLGAMTPAPAAAQSACGDSYRVVSGDTLSKIAGRCGTSVSALMQANPQISDPSRIEIGWNLRMPGAAYAAAPQQTYTGQSTYGQQTYGTQPVPQQPAPSDPYLSGYGQPAATAGTYAVQPGDTMGAIAQALGISLAALLSQNDNVDPSRLLIGQLLNLPTGTGYERGSYGDIWRDDRPARLALSSDSGRVGSIVAVHVRDLDRRERVVIGVRAPNGDLRKLGETRADTEGRADARVRVPDWADPGDELVFLVERENGRFVRAAPFEVTGRVASNDDRRDNGVIGRADSRLEGWIVRGVECPVLRASNGHSYGLVSDQVGLPLGAYVELRGRRTGQSFCQEGSATIEVADLRQVQPPR